MLWFALGCGGATATTTIAHPAPTPEATTAVPRVEITQLDAPLSGADRAPEGEGPVELFVGEDVLGSLPSGTHSRSDLRAAVFVPRGEWSEVRLGLTRAHLRGEDAELVATWLETLELDLPPGERFFAEGPAMEAGAITIVESIWDARQRVLGTLLAPDAPSWVRDAWALYQLARRKPGGVERLVESYVEHRARLGQTIEQDPAGAFWVSFCVDTKRESHEPTIDPRLLERWGQVRMVLDVDECLARVDARIVAHVVPIYDDASIRSFFRGATVEGTPPTVVRSPGPLRPGDVITHVRGEPLESLEQLGRHLGGLEPRHRVSIALQRGERTIRMWLRVPSMEVVREEVVFEIQPDPSQHPSWPFR